MFTFSFTDLGKRYEGIKKSLTDLAMKYPDLQDAYNSKIEAAVNFSQNFQNRELVIQVLNDLEKTLDEVENILKKVKEGKILHAQCVWQQRGSPTHSVQAGGNFVANVHCTCEDKSAPSTCVL